MIPSCFDEDDALGGVADSRLSAAITAGVCRLTRFGQWLQSRAHTSQASARRRQARSDRHVQVVDVQLPGPFPAVPPSLDRPDRWETLWEAEWRFPDEHINIKEARSGLW